MKGPEITVVKGFRPLAGVSCNGKQDDKKAIETLFPSPRGGEL